MIAPSRAAFYFDRGLPGGQPVPTRRWRVMIDVAALAPGRAAPRPLPRRLAAALDGLLTDGAPLAPAAPAEAAARAFTAGNGFLPGQIIDRAI